MRPTKLPGNPEQLSAGAKKMAKTADRIERIESDLALLKDADTFQSLATRELKAVTKRVKVRIKKVRRNYRDTANALTEYVEEMAERQKQLDAQTQKLESATSDMNSAADHANSARRDRDSGTPEQQEQKADDARRWEHRAGELRQQQRDAEKAIGAILEEQMHAASKTAARIRRALDRNDIRDSKWETVKAWSEDHAGLLKIVQVVLSILAVVVGVVAFIFGGWVLVLIGIGVAALIVTIMQYSAGDADKKDIAFSIVAVGLAALTSARLAKLSASFTGGKASAQAAQAARLAEIQQAVKNGTYLSNVDRMAIIANSNKAADIARKNQQIIRATQIEGEIDRTTIVYDGYGLIQNSKTAVDHGMDKHAGRISGPDLAPGDVTVSDYVTSRQAVAAGGGGSVAVSGDLANALRAPRIGGVAGTGAGLPRVDLPTSQTRDLTTATSFGGAGNAALGISVIREMPPQSRYLTMTAGAA